MKIVPLSQLPSGSKGKIVSINTGQGLARRLVQMGLVPGLEVEVVLNQGKGPILIKVRGTELAVSRGVAMKIMVEVTI